MITWDRLRFSAAAAATTTCAAVVSAADNELISLHAGPSVCRCLPIYVLMYVLHAPLMQLSLPVSFSHVTNQLGYTVLDWRTCARLQRVNHTQY